MTEVLTVWESKVLGYVGIALAAALPLQAAVEIVYWLKVGAWLDADTAMILGAQVTHEITSTGWMGVDLLLGQVLAFWVAFPVALLGVVLMKLSEL